MNRRIVILGAAGLDFHNFNVCFRQSPDDCVVAFTATQIPEIAGRTYPPDLAGHLYPRGIPIVPEEQLEHVIREHSVDTAVFSYSDVTHEHVMHLASRAVAAGADFLLLGSRATQLASPIPVVSVCAVRTGCGKSPVSRRVVQALREQAQRVVVVRHPMPYGDLHLQRVQRFASFADLDRFQCTIEEREEFEPHLAAGSVVYAGADYGAILARAAEEADVIVWDGGNNDTPFFRPDLEIVVADPLRAGHEILYFPGEVNLIRADVVVINKVDVASETAIETVRHNLRSRNPRAQIVLAASRISVDDPERLRGKRVLVVEDGPTLTHGGMGFGAGVVAAERFGAVLVDPRLYAVGSLREVFDNFPQIGALLPAMGYGVRQLAELQSTIARTPCDLVLVATPIDLARIIAIPRPALRVSYEIEERTRPALRDLIREFVQACPGRAGACPDSIGARVAVPA